MRIEPKPAPSHRVIAAWRDAVCAFVLSTLAGCGLGAGGPGTTTITVNTGAGWKPPPGAQPVALSTAIGPYEFQGLNVIVDGRPASPRGWLEQTYRQDGLLLSQIGPVGDPLAGRLHIVIADHDRLRLLTPANASPGALDFNAEQLRLNLHEVADVVVRAHAFANADLTEENDTASPDAAGADYVLYYRVDSLRPNDAGPWTGGWQVKRAHGAASLAVTSDPGTAPGPTRLLSFVKSLRRAVGGLAQARPGTRAAQAGRIISSGSGLIVDGVGHVLTDDHVIASCGDVRVTDNAGSTVPATLLANDAQLDLALLQTEHRWPAHARFARSQSLRAGEPVVATGYPLAGLISPEMAVTTGSITALSGSEAFGGERAMQFSAPVQPGNSGGPLLDEQGRVVGVVRLAFSSTVLAAALGGQVPQNVNIATKSDVARDFAAAAHVHIDEGSAAGRRGAADIGDAARQFTVRVECWRS